MGTIKVMVAIARGGVKWWIVGAVLAVLGGCSDSGGGTPTGPSTALRCGGGYPDWESSPYRLPYPVGAAYTVIQGNCTPYSHQGGLDYAYDLDLPMGSPVAAARSGTVVYLEEDWDDGDPEWYHSNIVRIRHDDGTFALYAHLTREGVLVDVGQRVQRGAVIALSGNSGYTLNRPHLHFQVAPCSFWENCGTLPVTFGGTAANPSGLVEGTTYLNEGG